jgi:hypothetical protein
MAFTMPIFMIPPNTWTHYVEISYTEFYPNRIKIVEILVKFHSRLPENTAFGTTTFTKLINDQRYYVKILPKSVHKFGRQGKNSFMPLRTIQLSLSWLSQNFLHFFTYTEFHENLTNSFVVDRSTRSKADRQILSLHKALMLY